MNEQRRAARRSAFHAIAEALVRHHEVVLHDPFTPLALVEESARALVAEFDLTPVIRVSSRGRNLHVQPIGPAATPA